jgi:hypothetical protein
MPTPLLVTKRPIHGLKKGPDKADQQQAYPKAGPLNLLNTKVCVSTNLEKIFTKKTKDKHAN